MTLCFLTVDKFGRLDMSPEFHNIAPEQAAEPCPAGVRARWWPWRGRQQVETPRED